MVSMRKINPQIQNWITMACMRLLCGLLIPWLILSAAVFVWSGPAEETYQIIGKVLLDGGGPPQVVSIVFLNDAMNPFVTQTSTGLSGDFSIKHLRKGTYMLEVYVPRTGQTAQTIEVGPGFADAKKNIRLTVTVKREPRVDREQSVSAAELLIPEQARKDYREAQESQKKRDVESALRYLQSAVKHAPKYCDAWNNLGTIAYLSGRFADAENYFRECLTHDAKYYPSLVNLGGALLSLKRYAEALDTNLQAVKMMPSDALAHAQLGLTYYYLARLDEAETELKRTKALDPAHFSHPQRFLASIYQTRQDFALMIMELEEFLKFHPDYEAAEAVRKAIESARTRLHPEP